jgi:hypothetical protein
MLGQTRFGKVQTAILVVIALVMGANLISPAVAHVTRKLNHLYKHLDPRYYNVGEKVGDADTLDGQDSTGFLGATGKAADADRLDGIDSTGFLQTSQIRLDGTHISATSIDDFTSSTYTSIASKTFTAPSNGFLFVVGSVSNQDDCGLAGSGWLEYRLRLDATAIQSGSGEEPYENDVGDCDDFFAGDTAAIVSASGAASAVVPVTAGSHTVHLDAKERGTGSYINGRSISIMFSPTGSGTTIPARVAEGSGGRGNT